MIAKNLKILIVIDALYHWGIGGVLPRPLSLIEAKEELHLVQRLLSDKEDASPQLKRQRLYKPEMANDASEL